MVNREATKYYKDWKSDLHDHFKSVGGEQNEQVARNNPPELRIIEHWGKCCDRFMSDAFRVILHSFTILLLVIYLNLNFTNTLYILKQKKSATNKSNRRNLKWSSLHGRVSYSLHRNKKVNIFFKWLFDKNIN